MNIAKFTEEYFRDTLELSLFENAIAALIDDSMRSHKNESEVIEEAIRVSPALLALAEKELSVRATPAEVKKKVADWLVSSGYTYADAGIMMNMSRASVSYALKVDKYFTNAQAKKYNKAFNFSIDYLTKGEGSL